MSRQRPGVRLSSTAFVARFERQREKKAGVVTTFDLQSARDRRTPKPGGPSNSHRGTEANRTTTLWNEERAASSFAQTTDDVGQRQGGPDPHGLRPGLTDAYCMHDRPRRARNPFYQIRSVAHGSITIAATGRSDICGQVTGAD